VSWRCQVGVHGWVERRRYFRGISTYIEQECIRCAARRTVWNAGQDIWPWWGPKADFATAQSTDTEG
jgi:hypothetical protein